MSTRVPSVLKKVDKSEATEINNNFSKAYATRVEGVSAYRPSASANVNISHQVMSIGEAIYSANGSSTIVKSFPTGESYTTILFAAANAANSAVSARVVDVTNSSLSIELAANSAGGDISSVTTSSLSVFWQVIGI